MSILEQLLKKAGKQLADTASKKVQKAVTTKTKTFTFTALPKNLEELKSLPEAALTDEFASAALTVLALNVYPEDREACFEMMDFLNGPDTLSGLDRQKLNDRFMDGKDYTARSYFKGAVPENNYTPAQPYTLTVIQSAHSRDTENEGYITLYLQSGGADSERGVRLRKKPSSGQWFVNQFEGLLAGIRIPKESDPWA